MGVGERARGTRATHLRTTVLSPSGLTQEPGSVGQLTLDCTEGAIEWLYPAGALRLTLGGPDPGTRPSIVCLRPARPFAGAQVFAERMGRNLELLLAEGPDLAGGRCVRWGPRERRALFLQATPHRDISRRVAAFRFELHEDQHAEMSPQAQGLGVDGEGLDWLGRMWVSEIGHLPRPDGNGPCHPHCTEGPTVA